MGSESLRRCHNCHLAYAPRYADPAEVYVEGYHSGDCGSFGNDSTHPEWRPVLDYIGERRIDFLEQVVQPPGSIVDVGCGTGETLAAAKRRGWDTAGVDLVPSAVKVATEELGLDVRESTLEESGLPTRSFDVVATHHVLEHQHDAAAFLTSIAQGTSRAAISSLRCRTGAASTAGATPAPGRACGRLEHIGHYSPRTLARLMRQVGFTPVLTRTPFFPMPGASVGQILRDFGLTDLAPILAKRPFAVPIIQRGETLRGPNSAMRRVYHGIAALESLLRGGVVLMMVARVP